MPNMKERMRFDIILPALNKKCCVCVQQMDLATNHPFESAEIWQNDLTPLRVPLPGSLR